MKKKLAEGLGRHMLLDRFDDLVVVVHEISRII